MVDPHIFIGVDPGLTGGIGIINTSTDLYLGMQMPVIKDYGIVCAELYDLFFNLVEGECLNSAIIFIERQTIWPGQGSTSSGTTMRGYGELIGTIKCTDIPYEEVMSSVWKKKMSLGKDKLRSITMAENLFPDVEYYTPRGRMLDGVAEALLIAEYGRLQYN